MILTLDICPYMSLYDPDISDVNPSAQALGDAFGRELFEAASP